jgi:hypothetical protein
MMARTIWKFALWENWHSGGDMVRIAMPHGAVVRFAGAQFDVPTVWAEVDPTEPLTDRIFEVCGTGHPLQPDPDGKRVYLGTAITNSGNLVWHIHERRL